MTTITEAITVPPDVTHGVPTGWGDWRYVVEILLVEDGEQMVVGTMQVGTARVASFTWVDLTTPGMGTSIRRGADEFFGRPVPGVAQITLRSTGGTLAAWNVDALEHRGQFLRPGALLRIGLRSATDARADGWLPLFAGRVETWPSEIGELAVTEWATVTAVETVSVLARVDDNALPGLVGGGETAAERLERLLDAARWRYGIVHAYTGVTKPLQSTDMAANRLTECYLSADSALLTFRTDKTGAARVEPHPYATVDLTPVEPVVYQFTNSGSVPHLRASWGGPLDPDFDAPVVPHSIVWANDDEALINAATFAVANTSTSATVEDLASISRFQGRYSTQRADLITDPSQATVVVESLAQMVVQVQSNLIRRCDAVELHNLQDVDAVTPIIAAIDWNDEIDLRDQRPGVRISAGCRVQALEHTIGPLNGSRLDWRCRLTLDTLSVQLEEV